MFKRQWALVALLILASVYARPTESSSNETEPNEDNEPTTPPTKMEPFHLTKVRVAGSRVEAREFSAENVVIGHSKKHNIVLKPNEPVRMILFGQNFQEIGAITFTSDGTCKDMEAFLEADFSSMTSSRLVVEMIFPENKFKTYKLCVSEKYYADPKFVVIEDPFTTVTTDVPVSEVSEYRFLEWIALVFLLMLSGLFSGLNLGLMTLSPYELQLYIASGTEEEKRYAEKILPIRKKGNQLLCTLLIGNVIVNVGISLLMDRLLGDGIYVLVGATALIVVFGEILPQAICVKWGLSIGARTIPITQFLLICTFPVTWTIAKCLDCFLREELTRSLERKKLVTMLKMSEKTVIGDHPDDFKMVLGALELYDKTVEDAMTKFDDIFMIPAEFVLGPSVVTQILEMGYTRIPLYEGDKKNVVSLLFVKDLALLDPNDNQTALQIATLYNHEVRRVLINMPLRTMLEEFKKGEYHMAFVEKLIEEEDKDPFFELCGLITLEDIIEEIIQCEIIDETDAVCDNVHRKKRQRKRNHDMSQIIKTANVKCAINVQLLAVTIQVMSTCHPLFSSKYIVPSILEKLIRTNCKKVEATQFSCLKEIGLVQKKPAILYTKGEMSQSFVMILTGTVLVKIGKESMELEAGAWHTFGLEVLDAMMAAIDRNQAEKEKSTASLNTEVTNNTIGFIPDFDASIASQCTFCEISAADLLLAYNSSQIVNNTKSPVVRNNSRTSLIEEIPKDFGTPRRNGSVKLRTVSESETVTLLPKNDVVMFIKEDQE